MPCSSMQIRRGNRWIWPLGRALAVTAFLLTCTACKNYRKLNEQNPYFQKAEAARAKGDYESAEGFFLECLKVSPESMKAHLQLGILYEEQMKDYPRAIVHYKAYFEAVGGQNEDVQRMLDRVERLYMEELLHKHAGGPAPTTAGDDESGPATIRVEPIDPDATIPSTGGGNRAYVVKEGDNLSGISIKVYGTSKHWDRIFQANRRKLKSPEKLKVGQTLVIPNLSE